MSPLIKLYAASTPNSHKIFALLEVLGLPYETIEVAILKGEQKQESFLKINPNGKVPVLKDELKGITIAQSGAIIQYLLEEYDSAHKISFARGSKEDLLLKEILFVESSEMVPSRYLALYYLFWSKEKFPPVIDRALEEVKRVLGVLESYLEGNKANGVFIGDRYSAADYFLAPWMKGLDALGIDIEEFPLLSAWSKKILLTPPVSKAFKVLPELNC